MIINKTNKILLKTKEFANEGIVILVNKPKSWTSFDVVKKFRTHYKIKKVGHSGTLDPNANGLMIIATNKKTKDISKYSGLEKEYIGKMILGAKTPSYDTETEIIEQKDYSNINKEILNDVFKKFIGVTKQKPPMYSAVKYRGKPLYKYARKGKKIEVKERIIYISELDILDFNPPEVVFKVICSTGTYIRSLVNDIGDALGCGAYLKDLTRVRIGTYKLEDALTIEELTSNLNADN